MKKSRYLRRTQGWQQTEDEDKRMKDGNERWMMLSI